MLFMPCLFFCCIPILVFLSPCRLMPSTVSFSPSFPVLLYPFRLPVSDSEVIQYASNQLLSAVAAAVLLVALVFSADPSALQDFTSLNASNLLLEIVN